MMDLDFGYRMLEQYYLHSSFIIIINNEKGKERQSVIAAVFEYRTKQSTLILH
jgi:hypothetical protein